MKLVTMRTANGTRAGRLDGDTVVELPDSDVGAILAGGAASLAAAASADGPRHAYADVDLAPVVPRPPKIICVGQNYMAHIAEMGSTAPKFPTLFAKYTRALIGPRDAITLPKVSDKIDWEVELAIVIGNRARYLESVQDAWQHIAGYTVSNDVSERTFQLEQSGGQWSKGKCCETFNPLGPALVPADEVDPGNLRLRSFVNGEPRQDSSTADLIFDVPTIVHHLSQFAVLEPGDVINTGTPEGVALSGRFPYLTAGDVMEVEIEGLGRARQLCGQA